jgi:hypothetical protein
VLRILRSINAMFAKLSDKLKGIALGFGLPRLPIMIADDDENFKDKIKDIVLAIVVLVVGAKTVSNISEFGVLIINVFNSTVVKIPPSYNFVEPIASASGSIFQILVVVLVIVALLSVIRYLMRAPDSF